MSEHQQDQTGLGREGVVLVSPKAKCEVCRLVGSEETDLEIRKASVSVWELPNAIS